MDLDHLKKLVLAAHDEETDGPAFDELLAYLEELRPLDAALIRWAKAEAEINELRAQLASAEAEIVELRDADGEPVFENGQTLAEVKAVTAHERYFADHSTVHDRETGKHVFAEESAQLMNEYRDQLTARRR